MDVWIDEPTGRQADSQWADGWTGFIDLEWEIVPLPQHCSETCSIIQCTRIKKNLSWHQKKQERKIERALPFSVSDVLTAGSVLRASLVSASCDVMSVNELSYGCPFAPSGPTHTHKPHELTAC